MKIEPLLCLSCGTRNVHKNQFLCFKCKKDEERSTLDAIDTRIEREAKQEAREYLESRSLR